MPTTSASDGVQVRTPDGLHFTRAGGDMIANKVIKAMEDTFDLTSWQKSVPSTTTTTVAGSPSTTGAGGATEHDEAPGKKSKKKS